MLETDSFIHNDKPLSQVYQTDFHNRKFRMRDTSRPKWMQKKYPLEDLRPEKGPFVPTFLVLVINRIEDMCNDAESDFWLAHYKGNDEETKTARNILYECIVNRVSTRRIRKMLDGASLEVLTTILSEFFSLLPRKLIFVENKKFAKIVVKPLFDASFRVNPLLIHVIKQSVIRMSRTRMDTLAFLMTHVLHLWEYSESPHISKDKIADIYGPWIIELEGKAIVSKHCAVQSPEALLLLAIMNSTDPIFWDSFSMMEVGKLFENTTPFERKRIFRRKTLNFMRFCYNEASRNPMDSGSTSRKQSSDDGFMSMFQAVDGGSYDNKKNPPFFNDPVQNTIDQLNSKQKSPMFVNFMRGSSK